MILQINLLYIYKYIYYSTECPSSTYINPSASMVEISYKVHALLERKSKIERKRRERKKERKKERERERKRDREQPRIKQPRPKTSVAGTAIPDSGRDRAQRGQNPGRTQNRM